MGRDELTTPGRRLPDLDLPSADGKGMRILPSGRRSHLIVVVHERRCPACEAFVRSLEAEREEIESWDGRVLAVRDPERRLGDALGLETPAVVVADQWGEVHLAHAAGDEHAFPTPAELVQWLRYLAIQCPECQGEAY